MTIQKVKPAFAVLTACVGVALAGGLALRAQPGDLPKEPAKLTGRADPGDKGIPLPKEGPEEPAKKVKELQKERITVLKDLVDQTTAQFRTGRASYEEVLEAQMLLLKAQLDAAEKELDRIAIYKRTVDALRTYEKVAEARVQAGQGTPAAVLKIKARRLEVEIQLEQAKAKEAKEGK